MRSVAIAFSSRVCGGNEMRVRQGQWSKWAGPRPSAAAECGSAGATVPLYGRLCARYRKAQAAYTNVANMLANANIWPSRQW